MSPPIVRAAWVQQQVEPVIWERGEDYFRRGAVLSLVRRGQMLYAEVEGSDVDPYRVHVVLRPGASVEAECSCPYGEEWGGWCKHIVAVLLSAAREPEGIEEEPALDELLAGLDREQLRGLVQQLVQHHPDLYDRVAAAVAGRRARSEL